MVVQTRVDLGYEVQTRTYRNIIKHKNLAELREGFYGQREHCRWGLMIELRGDKRTVLGRFGEVPADEEAAPRGTGIVSKIRKATNG